MDETFTQTQMPLSSESDYSLMQMLLLRSIVLAGLTILVSGNVLEDLNCKAQTAAAEAQLQNEVFVEGLIRCLKRWILYLGICVFVLC